MRNINYEQERGLLQFDIMHAVIGKKQCCFMICCCQEIIGAPEFSTIQGGFYCQKNIINDANIQKKKFQVLFNPAAGGGHCLAFINKIKQKLSDLQENKLEFLESKSLDHFKQVVQDYNYENSDKALFICGGDGSLSNTINFYFEQRTLSPENNNKQNKIKTLTIGILPGGTANDFCTSLQIDAENYNVEKILKNPIIRKIDIVKICYFDEKNQKQTKYFVDNLGVGFSARVAKRANNECFYKLFFRSKYKVSAFREIITNQKDIMTIEDEQGNIILDKVGIQLLTFNNVQTIGKLFRSTPYAQIDDGLIDMMFLDCNSRARNIELLEAVEKNGSHIYMPETHYYKGRKFKVRFEPGVLVCASLDGENIYFQNQLEVEVVQNFLNIIM